MELLNQDQMNMYLTFLLPENMHIICRFTIELMKGVT